MVKRAVYWILAVMILFSAALADMQWKQNTPAQQILKQYIEETNRNLTGGGETPINSLFEMYDAFAVLGITEEPDAETPEGIEITVRLFYDSMDMLELRVNDTGRFPGIAAALIRAMYGENDPGEKVLEVPRARAEQFRKEPARSYEEPVDDMNGTMPRIYYAYYPDQYRDGVSWAQMTIIFPMAGAWDGGSVLLGQTDEKGVDPDSGASEDYEGYYSRDDYSHFEVFTTSTPEPDSAAAEFDFR